MLSMRNGCAGFFTQAQLDAGRGVIRSRRPLPPPPADLPALAPEGTATLDAAQLNALRDGDLVGAFGDVMRGLSLTTPLGLPGGKLDLVHRVTALDTRGGPSGLGFAQAEADIHPGDWFLTCHFVDDQVMPGTLMYECCLHTLRILLMRKGWVGQASSVAFEPAPGVRFSPALSRPGPRLHRRRALRDHDPRDPLRRRAHCGRRRPHVRRRQADR